MNTILSTLGIIAMLGLLVFASAIGLDKELDRQDAQNALHCEQYPEKRAGGYCGE
jgi:hypothetical protein